MTIVDGLDAEDNELVRLVNRVGFRTTGGVIREAYVREAARLITQALDNGNITKDEMRKIFYEVAVLSYVAVGSCPDDSATAVAVTTRALRLIADKGPPDAS